jgi:transketolase
MRKTFVEVVSKSFSISEQPFLLLGDIGVFGFSKLQEEFPNRVVNVGIMEQAMIGIASGLAMKGMIPTIHTIAPFMVERAFEQIKVDFGYQGLPGNFVSVGASFDYAALGCTHHCPGDISLISTIPNSKVYVPGNSKEFANQYMNHWNDGNLNYFRLSENNHSIDLPDFDSGIYKIKSGSLASVFVVGPMLEQTFQATNQIDVDLYYVNELSNSLLEDSRDIDVKSVVIIVEPYYSGPLANLLIESRYLKQNKIRQIGVPREFLNNYGTKEEHLSSLQLDVDGIRSRIKSIINE